MDKRKVDFLLVAGKTEVKKILFTALFRYKCISINRHASVKLLYVNLTYYLTLYRSKDIFQRFFFHLGHKMILCICISGPDIYIEVGN